MVAGRPSYEELAALVVEQRAEIFELKAHRYHADRTRYGVASR